MKFDNSFITELKQQLPQYLRNLHGNKIKSDRGDFMQLLCPYHEEKTASFNLNIKEGKPLFKCYGCGRGGDIISCAKLDANTDNFPDAVKYACGVLSITCPEPTKPQTKEEREELNRKLAENRKAQAQRDKEKAVTQKRVKHLQEQLPKILNSYKNEYWREELHAELLSFNDDPELDAHAFIAGLFPDQSTIWCGDVKDSGSEKHSKHFRPANEWREIIESRKYIPARICPSTFQSGIHHRSKDFALDWKYICIEGDELIGHKATTVEEQEENKHLNYCLAKFCREVLGMKLVAVIDTGGKSLHLWFVMPPSEDFNLLCQIADGIGVDTATLTNPVAPLRLPNCIHNKTKKRASLLMFNPPIAEPFFQ